MKTCHRIALLGLIALAMLQVVWYGWWLPPTQLDRVAVIAFALAWFVLPLLAARVDAGHGLLVGALIALGFFSHGVMEAWANPSARAPALVEIVLSLAVVAFAGWPSWQGASARKRARTTPG